MQSEYPDMEIVFFGQRMDGLKELRLEGTRWVPRTAELQKAIKFTSGGREFVDTEEFDAFLIYGLGANAFFVDENMFFTRKVLRQAAEDATNHSLSFRLLKDLSGIYGKPIYVGHTPLPAAPKFARDPDVGSYVKGIAFINDVVYNPMGACFLPQPIETIGSGRCTDVVYSQGSKRLAVGDGDDDEIHPDIDKGHMNDTFGAMWLRNFFAILSVHPETDVNRGMRHGFLRHPAAVNEPQLEIEDGQRVRTAVENSATVAAG